MEKLNIPIYDIFSVSCRNINYEIILLSEKNIFSKNILIENNDLEILRDFKKKELTFKDDEVKNFFYFLEKSKLENIFFCIIRQELLLNKIGILREQSFGIHLLKCIWFAFEGKQYFDTIAKPFIIKIISNTKNNVIEIDPEKTSYQNLNKNRQKLFQFVDQFFELMHQFKELLSPSFYKILYYFYECLTEIEGREESHLCLNFSEKAASLFGGFLFLRFIIPPLTQPEYYNLLPPNTKFPKTSARTIILISKILQNIANQINFDGTKEDYMSICNSYVDDRFPILLAFVNNLMH